MSKPTTLNRSAPHSAPLKHQDIEPPQKPSFFQRIAEKLPAAQKRARQAEESHHSEAEGQVDKLLLAVEKNDVAAAQLASVQLDSKLVALKYQGTKRDLSPTQLRNNCFLNMVGAKSPTDLRKLLDKLESFQTADLKTAGLRESTMHLAFLVKSEILHREMVKFMEEGALFSGDESGLSVGQKESLSTLRKLAPELQQEAVFFAQLGKGEALNARFSRKALDRFVVELSGLGAKTGRRFEKATPVGKQVQRIDRKAFGAAAEHKAKLELEAKSRLELGNLVTAIRGADEATASLAGTRLNLALASIHEKHSSLGQSELQLRGRLLLETVTAMQDRDLDDLLASIEGMQPEFDFTGLKGWLEHLAVSARAEILRRGLDVLAKEGVRYGQQDAPDFQKLDGIQRQDVIALAKIAAPLKTQMRPYADPQTNVVVGANLGLDALDRIVAQLGAHLGMVNNMASKEIEDLVVALKNGEEDVAELASLMLDGVAAPAHNPGVQSTVELRHPHLLSWVAACDLDDLLELDELLDPNSLSTFSPALADVATHLAVLAKSEILYRWIELDAIELSQSTEISRLPGIASDVQSMGGPYLTGEALGEVQDISSDLGGYVERQNAVADFIQSLQKDDTVRAQRIGNEITQSIGGVVAAGSGASDVQLRGALLLQAARSMKAVDLYLLEPKLASHLAKSPSPSLREVIEHLSLAVRAEMLRRAMEDFAKRRVFFGEPLQANWTGLSNTERVQIVALSQASRRLLQDAGNYVDPGTGEVAGAGIAKTELEHIASLLESQAGERTARSLLTALTDADFPAVQKFGNEMDALVGRSGHNTSAGRSAVQLRGEWLSAVTRSLDSTELVSLRDSLVPVLEASLDPPLADLLAQVYFAMASELRVRGVDAFPG
ncbi:hypothetical protein [Hydrogenophaga sp. BPS33]|uniref:hypothetical protein n=1 Tax=Hydrogenophaga sp. BPS33 TaxID=2651974 RepID=UPI0013202897|nr:hypothetical protein [Hydrogenophaga sp. BPS33]QHE85294.1 hypothetical protein F9K07_10505 [Hydrogenophaga sp. BPS33]